MPGSPDRGSKGFTLLELLVVIVILALIGGLVLARGPAHSERLDAETAARQLAGALRLARTEAIAHNRVVTFTLDTSGHAYRIEGKPPVALPRAVGMSMAGAAASGPIGAIRFAPDGSSSGGRIALRAGDYRPEIQVDWLTGKVRVTQDH